MLTLDHGVVIWNDRPLVRLTGGKSVLAPRWAIDPALDAVPSGSRETLVAAFEQWLSKALTPLAALRRLEAASTGLEAGPELRALLIRLVDAGGVVPRDASGLERLSPAQRAQLTGLGVTVGALDLFVPAMLRPAVQSIWRELASLRDTVTSAPSPERMPPVIAAGIGPAPAGYRRLGQQLLRIDLAERLLRDAHGIRITHGRHAFVLDPAKAISMGLATASFAQLLRLGGFQPIVPRPLSPDAAGPPAPLVWRWRPARRDGKGQATPDTRAVPPLPSGDTGSAFATLAGLFA